MSDGFIQNTHYPIHSHMNYRSIMDSLSCVEGIRLTTVLYNSTNPLSHPYQLSVSRVESEFNIQFTLFNLTSEIPTEKLLVSKEKKTGVGGGGVFQREPQLCPKWEKKSGLTERRATGVSTERQREVEGRELH